MYHDKPVRGLNTANTIFHWLKEISNTEYASLIIFKQLSVAIEQTKIKRMRFSVDRSLRHKLPDGGNGNQPTTVMNLFKLT